MHKYDETAKSICISFDKFYNFCLCMEPVVLTVQIVRIYLFLISFIYLFAVNKTTVMGFATEEQFAAAFGASSGKGSSKACQFLRLMSVDSGTYSTELYNLMSVDSGTYSTELYNLKSVDSGTYNTELYNLMSVYSVTYNTELYNLAILRKACTYVQRLEIEN